MVIYLVGQSCLMPPIDAQRSALSVTHLRHDMTGGCMIDIDYLVPSLRGPVLPHPYTCTHPAALLLGALSDDHIVIIRPSNPTDPLWE